MIVYIPLALALLLLIGLFFFEHKLWAAAVLVVMIPLIFFITISGTSHPKNYEWEYFKEDTYVIAYNFPREEDRIFLWVEGDNGPLYYSLEWNEEIAEQLQEAFEEAKKNDTEVMLEADKFKDGFVLYPTFKALPIPTNPQKTMEQ